MRIYGKRVPAKQAAREFTERVRRQIHISNLREKEANDVEKSRFSHREWSPATESTTNALEKKLKEPNTLLFFKGAKYEFTYNEEGKFSQSQTAILYDLPSQEYLDSWRNIKVLAAPPGMKDIQLNVNENKQYFIERGFKEVNVGIAPERTCILTDNIQAQRKQYGLKHRVTGTIHAAMGDTLNSMATEISRSDPNFKIWDKGQLVVLISRTTLARNTIFVGDKSDTLNALKEILIKRTQWTDYMENVLDLITINSNSEIREHRTLTQNNYPFRICDVPLPQCRTGYVYMLLSLKNRKFLYIGETICIRDRIVSHNSGRGASETTSPYLRPYAVLAYISGGLENKDLRLHIEQKWTQQRNHLMQQGIEDPKILAKCASSVINQFDSDYYRCERSNLILHCLFRDE